MIEFFVIGGLFLLWGYLIWAQQQRLEIVAQRVNALAIKVKQGEDAIVENFKIIEKGMKRLENEIKSTQRIKPQNKEAIKAANKVQRISRDQ